LNFELCNFADGVHAQTATLHTVLTKVRKVKSYKSTTPLKQ